jgi:hypothetical protein
MDCPLVAAGTLLHLMSTGRLEMLWAQKHSFMPMDFCLKGHRQTCFFLLCGED